MREGSLGDAKTLTRGGGGTCHGELSLGRHRGKMPNAGAWLLVAMSFADCENAPLQREEFPARGTRCEQKR